MLGGSKKAPHIKSAGGSAFLLIDRDREGKRGYSEVDWTCRVREAREKRKRYSRENRM